MEHCRNNKAYTPKTRAEQISYTVAFYPRKLSMPEMLSTDATIHAEQDLIHALQNPAPDRTLVKLENVNKEALISLSEIFGKATSKAVPQRVPIAEA